MNSEKLKGHILILITNILFAVNMPFSYKFGAVRARTWVYLVAFFGVFLIIFAMEHLPYLNLDRGWYVYFLRLLLLGTVLITLFHLPFLLYERRKREEKN